MVNPSMPESSATGAFSASPEQSALRPTRQVPQRWLLVTALFLWLGVMATATAAVRASLDRQQVYEGDQVTLRIVAEGSGAHGQPDLAPLRDDFRIAGTSSAQQMQFINGRRSQQRSWQVALEPKRLGTLMIPALRVGSERTQPLTLEVEPVPAGGLGAPGDEVWLEVALEGDADALVVQQQVPLVVRAYSAQPLLDYALEMPPVEGAVLARIGRDQTRLTTRAGRQYRVIERRYMLNPERSGSLRIPPVTFKAELKEPSAQRPGSAPGLSDLFDDPMFERMLGRVGVVPGLPGFGRGRPVRAMSDALALRVAPIPKAFQGAYWLPAIELEIRDSWNPADGGAVPRLEVGEPVTRTLRLIATGLAGNQIPEIEIPVPEGFRVYPEQTAVGTRSDGQTVIGESRQQVTMIPARAGDFELPPIRVRWWDTETNQGRVAEVPARSVTVASSVSAATDAALAAAEQASAPGAEREQPSRAGRWPESTPAGETASGEGDSGGWRRVLSLLGGGLLLALGAVVFRWWRGRAFAGRRRASATSSDEGARLGARAQQAERMADAQKALRAACERNDARAAAAALLQWGSAQWSQTPPLSLRALAEQVAQPQRGAIEALEQALYGADESPWCGDALWQALADGFRTQAPSGAPRASDGCDAAGLAPLYPNQT